MVNDYMQAESRSASLGQFANHRINKEILEPYTRMKSLWLMPTNDPTKVLLQITIVSKRTGCGSEVRQIAFDIGSSGDCDLSAGQAP
jgi:hypothetical protein